MEARTAQEAACLAARRESHAGALDVSCAGVTPEGLRQWVAADCQVPAVSSPPEDARDDEAA